MSHHKGESWNDRELNRAPLTTTAFEAAAKAIITTIREFPEGTEPTEKGSLLNRIAGVMGSAFPTDAPPPRGDFIQNDAGLPANIGEMKQRIDKLANKLSNDQYLQDICRAASAAAVDAAKATMQPAQGKH